jgi:hypothetical protein
MDGCFFDDFSHQQGRTKYTFNTGLHLLVLFDGVWNRWHKQSQPTNQTNKQTNKQECHDFECLLLLPLDNNYFAFDCEKLFCEGSSRLGLLSEGPPLSLFDMLLGVGNLMFPLWFSFLVVLLSSWTWVLPFCSFYSLGGGGLLRFIFDWEGFIIFLFNV